MESIRGLQLQDSFLISTTLQQYTSNRIFRPQGRLRERATVSGDYLVSDARLKPLFTHFHRLELPESSTNPDPRFYIGMNIFGHALLPLALLFSVFYLASLRFSRSFGQFLISLCILALDEPISFCSVPKLCLELQEREDIDAVAVEAFAEFEREENNWNENVGATASPHEHQGFAAHYTSK